MVHLVVGEKMKRAHHKLRIVWTAFFGVLAILLCLLCLRTRYSHDIITGPLSSTKQFAINSRNYGVGVVIGSIANEEWQHYTRPPNESMPKIIQYKTALGFIQYQVTANLVRVRVPYWSLILLAALIGSIPWISFRFSLRTLLIAVTLVAVGLGFIVWMAKR